VTWPLVPLREIAEARSGVVFPPSLQGRTAGEIPFAKVADITQAVRSGAQWLNVARNYVASSDLARLKAQVFPPGTIAFAKIGEAIRQNFRAITDRPMLFDNNVMGLVPDGVRVEPSFLLHYLRSIDFYHLAGKTTVPAIRKSVLQALRIPLPPLAEQRRIAAILDKADAIRRKRQQAIRLTDDLLRSAFLDLFGDPVTNPRRWAEAPFSSTLQGLEAGWSAKGDDRPREEGEWAVLKISAVTSGRFDPSQHKVVHKPPAKKRPLVPRRGDLLFSRANTRELVGAVALVEQDANRLFLPDKLWRLVPNRRLALPEYLRFVLSHPGYQRGLATHATGTSGSMLNVSQAKFLRMQIPLPPVTRQADFAALVWGTYDTQEVMRRSGAELDILREALVQRAFRGDMWTASTTG
jgi:type I restriction enzyme, S subunit